MRTERRLALAAVVVGIVACAAVIFGSTGGGYQIHALFEDAGQLVSGGQVQVAGRTVGSISGLNVTPHGLADVTLSIDDADLTPLHQGTRAIIRAVGQAGVDNRFVQLIPGSESSPALRSGATLPTSQTTGIVDLDAVLDTFDPSTRSSLQQLFAHSSAVFAGSGARYFNQMLARLDPALTALDRLSGQIAGDRLELGQLVHSGAIAAGAVSSRSTDLEGAVANVARAFTELADEREPFADLLVRAPRVLALAQGTLARVSTTVTALRPTLRALVPVSHPLARFLSLVGPTLSAATPVIGRLTGELAPLRTTLSGVVQLEPPTVTALRTTVAAYSALLPLLTGIREYGSDIVLGIFNGLGGLVSGPYTSEGHYAKLNFVQSLQTLFAGIGSQILSSKPLLPGLLAVRTHLLARCPGGDAPPAPDGSNPWVPSSTLCNPADDLPASVNQP